MPSRSVRLLLALTLILPASAEVSTLRYFRLGEADGASAGSIATTTADSSGHSPMDPLTVTGGALYAADTANEQSQLSLEFDGSQYATTGNPDIPATDFGVEIWVKPDEAGDDGVILYSGDPGTDGWGIIKNPDTDKFCALFGGRTFFGEGLETPGQWTHLAFVCTGTTSAFYVNGTASGASVAVLPAPSGQTLRIAAAPANPAATFFKGKLDDLRIFTFAPGAFIPADLLCNLSIEPPALEFSRIPHQDTLRWPSLDRGFGLETTTNLTSGPWTPVYRPVESNGLFSITIPSTEPSRFYRLKKPCGVFAPPMLPPGQFLVITNGATSKNVTNINATTANRISGAVNAKIDASAFIDPANCNGGLDALEFHWIILYPQNPDQPFTDRGTSGYRTPVLSFTPNALALQPDPPSSAGPGARFVLSVTSKLTGLTTTVDLQAQVVSSQLSLSLYNDCQTKLEACDFCDCTIEAALPVLPGTDT